MGTPLPNPLPIGWGEGELPGTVTPPSSPLPIGSGEAVLRPTITTTEMREKAPANTIGFSRLAGRKWTCASARMDFARVNGMERIASQRQATAARGLAFGHNAAARNNTTTGAAIGAQMSCA